MATEEEARVHEIRIGGCANSAAALALQEPVARVLCPEPEHGGPCGMPWELTLRDEEEAEEGAVLVVGVHAAEARVAEVAERVRAVVGEAHPVEWGEGAPEDFEVLVEQHRVEQRGGRRGSRG